MIELRPFERLGGADHGWLKARHHFSFAGYHDPQRTGWGALRVWNDDEIAPGSGFPAHPHADMEIITYVREGAITHKDSMGNVGRTEAGDVQVMSAGSGVRHSEYNLEDDTTRIFQIWIVPETRGGAPSWGARPFPKVDRSAGFVTLASGMPGDAQGEGEGDGVGGALAIRAEARVLGASVKAGERVSLAVDPARHFYLVPASGAVEIDGLRVGARDGAAITAVSQIEILGLEDAEIVLVDAA